MMGTFKIVPLALGIGSLLSSCYTPTAPSTLPNYRAPSAGIDNDNWSATTNQAVWKENGDAINREMTKRMITGRAGDQW